LAFYGGVIRDWKSDDLSILYYAFSFSYNLQDLGYLQVNSLQHKKERITDAVPCQKTDLHFYETIVPIMVHNFHKKPNTCSW